MAGTDCIAGTNIWHIGRYRFYRFRPAGLMPIGCFSIRAYPETSGAGQMPCENGAGEARDRGISGAICRGSGTKPATFAAGRPCSAIATRQRTPCSWLPCRCGVHRPRCAVHKHSAGTSKNCSSPPLLCLPSGYSLHASGRWSWTEQRPSARKTQVPVSGSKRSAVPPSSVQVSRISRVEVLRPQARRTISYDERVMRLLRQHMPHARQE